MILLALFALVLISFLGQVVASFYTRNEWIVMGVGFIVTMPFALLFGGLS